MASAAHPSIQSHLATEHALLKALGSSARHQHRAQPFMRRLDEVLRLTGLLRMALQNASDDGGHARLARLVPRFEAAVMNAARHTEQIIELHHFLPLQVMLLAIYARLFTLSADLGRVYVADQQPKEPRGSSHQPPPQPLPMNDDMDMDVGVPVLLDVDQKLPVSLPPAPSPVQPLRPAIVPSMPPPQPIRKAPAEAERPKKKKKKAKNAMDDIFGI